MALVLAFLSVENENREREDLPLADFGRLPEGLLLSVGTKSKMRNLSIENYHHCFFFVIMVQRIFPS